MEVQRNEPPNIRVFKLLEIYATKNIVLIFDECTSGFRETFEAYIKNLVSTQIWLCLGKRWVMDMQ